MKRIKIKEKKLNLGCGKRIMKGYFNVDFTKYPGVDLLWDLNKTPLPFEDEQFEEIICRDILEHIDYVPLMDEIYRILKDGGKLKIRVPHFTNVNAYVDPTHIKFFSSRTFSYFVKGHAKEYPFKEFSKYKSYISFEKRPSLFWNYFLEKFVNINDFMRGFYERSPLRIFPAASMPIELVK